MKRTHGLRLWRDRLYGLTASGIWAFRTSPGPTIKDVGLEYSLGPGSSLRLYGLVPGPTFMLTALRFRTLSSEDPPERVANYEKAQHVYEFPLAADGRLAEPVSVALGPPRFGAYPLATCGSTLYCGTDKSLAAVDIERPRDLLWSIEFTSWRRGFLAVSEDLAYVSTNGRRSEPPRLWKVSRGTSQPIDLGESLVVFCLDSDPAGRLLAGVVHAENREDVCGLLVLEGGKWALHSVRPSGLVEEIQDVAVGPDGSVWFATLGSGIVRFKDESWEHWTTANGIGSDTHDSVVVDPEGVAWFWSGRSLDWARPEGSVGCAWQAP